jgi:hypothetical protein
VRADMSNDLKPRDLDDTPPSGEEARRLRIETAMPLVWGLLGLIAAVVFVIGLASHWATR